MREKVVARRLSALQAFRLCRGLGGSPLIAFRLSPQACKRHLVVEPCCVRMRGARLVYRGWTAVGPISACMRGPNALCESIAELIENGELNLKLDAANEADVQCQNGNVGEQQVPHAAVFAPCPHSRRQAQMFRRFPDVQSRDRDLLREKEAE
ncbi:hypothetical protein KC347_g79 [Hortaea werneckii]|nr:hypothetical protein KC347_g79 [Hortaea werneckii]